MPRFVNENNYLEDCGSFSYLLLSTTNDVILPISRHNDNDLLFSPHSGFRTLLHCIDHLEKYCMVWNGFFHIISLFVSLSSRSFTVLMRIGVEHLAMLCIIFPCSLYCSGYDMTLCKWQWVIENFEENRGHFHFLVQNTHKKNQQIVY